MEKKQPSKFSLAGINLRRSRLLEMHRKAQPFNHSSPNKSAPKSEDKHAGRPGPRRAIAAAVACLMFAFGLSLILRVTAAGGEAVGERPWVPTPGISSAGASLVSVQAPPKPSVQLDAPPVAPEPLPQFQGTLVTRNGRCALVSNGLATEGELIGSYRILRITEDHIVVQDPDEAFAFDVRTGTWAGASSSEKSKITVRRY